MDEKRKSRREKGRERGHEFPNQEETAEKLDRMTPPPRTRTDPDRGTGEMGTEEMDPSKPLPD